METLGTAAYWLRLLGGNDYHLLWANNEFNMVLELVSLHLTRFEFRSSTRDQLT